MEKKKVKERKRTKAPKVSAASRKIPQDMKTGYRKVDEQTVPADERYDSPSDYATQKSEQCTYETAAVAYSGAKKVVRKVKEKVEDKIRDKVEDLEKRREQKETDRSEQYPLKAEPKTADQPRPESHTPDQPQQPDPLQRRSNQPSTRTETRVDTAKYEIAPKQKAEMLQERFGQQKVEPKTTDQPQQTSVQPNARFNHVMPKQKEEETRQSSGHSEPKQKEEPSVRSSGSVQSEISTQQKAEILQKQRHNPNEPVQETHSETPAPKETRPESKTAHDNTAYKGGDHHAIQRTEPQSHSVESNQRLFRSEQRPAHTAKSTGQKSVSSVKQGAKGTVKTTEKTVQTTQKTVKTAERSVKTAERTAKTASKAAEKGAKAAEKAAKVAKELAVKAARAAQKMAEMTAKAIQAAIKAIVAAIKALVAAIAAGGWVAVVIILVIAHVAAIICICFGLFWSNDASPEGPTMTEIITRIDQSYKNAIDKRIKKFEKEIDHDELEVVYRGDNNDGDSAAVNNWIDVLAVYSVLSTTGENPIIILVPDDECEQRLRDVFSVMNTVGFTYELHEVVPENAPTPTPDEDGNTPEPETVTQLIVNVHQRSMTYREAAEYYHFDESQMQLLEEMMSSAYTKYYAALIGVDLLGGADYTEIISHLPSNNKGADVVRAALTKLGCPYVWGAKGSAKFDCSGLAYWAIHEVDPELGDHMYTNAAGQAKYCYDRGLLVAWSELEPGDLVFWVNKKCEGCHRWKEIHHVGIYVGDGKVVEASSSKGCVVVRDLWQTKNYPIIMFGRPYQ